ncbi:MAG: N-acetylmuramic acid 6-phosphate etherase [Vicinamibacterales bacterium]
MPVRSKWQSLPTEAINPATLAIDKLSSADIVEGMLNEDRKMLAAVHREKERIAVGVDIITQALRKNGRIIFVGAGTSGRLGILESAEMPPTFGTSTDFVLAIMAGGKNAILRTKEGVEDNYEEGARSMMRLKPTKKDVVIGVSASGMTQFVRGALTRARRVNAKIIFVTCDPRTELQTFVDLTIAPAVGPEVIAGSTRLKAGTATKIVLNMLTTGAMVRTGKTYGNLMVDVQIGSEKLRDRARRIITIVTGLEYRGSRQAAAARTLERQGRDRDAEGGAHLPARARATAQSARLRTRRHRRRRRAAAARAARRTRPRASRSAAHRTDRQAVYASPSVS